MIAILRENDQLALALRGFSIPNKQPKLILTPHPLSVSDTRSGILIQNQRISRHKQCGRFFLEQSYWWDCPSIKENKFNELK